MSQDKLVIRLSSSALSRSGCMLNFHRTVIEGYKELLMPARMVYGIAVHKFIDTMYKSSYDIQKSVAAAKTSFNIPKYPVENNQKHLADERHMLSTCLNLWSTFIDEEKNFELIMLNDTPATEVTFSIKYYEDDYIIVYLEGTIDKVGQFKGGCFAVGDWKTTSAWSVDTYFKRYELSRQLRFYTLVCKLASKENPDSTLGRIGATRMGAFIDAIFVKPDANNNVVKRSVVYQYTDDDIEDFGILLNNFIFKLSSFTKHRLFEKKEKEGMLNGSCESKFGLCSFWNVCKSTNEIGNILLERDFKKVVFNPMNYNEE